MNNKDKSKNILEFLTFYKKMSKKTKKMSEIS